MILAIVLWPGQYWRLGLEFGQPMTESIARLSYKARVAGCLIGQGDMSDRQASQGELMRMVVMRILLSILILFVMLFLPAGTFAYWEAWVYLSIFFIAMLAAAIYLLGNMEVDEVCDREIAGENVKQGIAANGLEPLVNLSR